MPERWCATSETALAFAYDEVIGGGSRYSVNWKSTKRLASPASPDGNVIPEGRDGALPVHDPNHTTRHAKPLQAAIRDGFADIVITYTDSLGSNVWSKSS